MFFPGETIQHSFIIPFAASEIDHIILSYKQNEAIVFEKTITSGFTSEGTELTQFEYSFRQEDTLLFDDNEPFTIQLNVYTVNGSRHASQELKSSSGIQYYRDVMQPLDKEHEVHIKIRVIYNSDDWPDEGFRFKLVGAEMPEGSIHGEKILAVMGKEVFDFGSITYSNYSEMDYFYTLSQLIPTGSTDGIIYDNTVYDIKVNVKSLPAGTKEIKVYTKTSSSTEYVLQDDTSVVLPFTNIKGGNE